MKLDTGDLKQVELANRTLRYLCRGEGAPTVIVEQGNALSFGGAISPAMGWIGICCEIEKITRICIHDGTAQGGGIGEAARTSENAVDDLRAILHDARLTPPYVLVGHSIGGLNARLFASRYPDEVAGMVLVDSFHPNQHARLSKSLRPKRIAASIMDGIDIDPSAALVRKTGMLGIKPLVVLTRSSRDVELRGLPAELLTRMRAAWLELQTDLLTLSANSTHVIASHAGHNIQLEEPRLVIDAIAKVVHEIRSQPHRLH